MLHTTYTHRINMIEVYCILMLLLMYRGCQEVCLHFIEHNEDALIVFIGFNDSNDCNGQ